MLTFCDSEDGKKAQQRAQRAESNSCQTREDITRTKENVTKVKCGLIPCDKFYKCSGQSTIQEDALKFV